MDSMPPVSLPLTQVLGMALALHGGVGFQVAASVAEPEPGLALLTLELSAGTAAPPPALDLLLRLPSPGVYSIWRSNADHDRLVRPDWAPARVVSKATSQAPVLCLIDQQDVNLLTVALDDGLHPAELEAGVNEEHADLRVRLRLFRSLRQPAASHRVVVRIDRRALPFQRPLAEIAAWWAALYPPMAVPDCGRRPMYSTWYSFHQALDVPRVVEQCRLAKAMGCAAVIVDDGWQCTDGSRGYAWCGDWKPERIPAMRAFVDAVHAVGMQFLLWYSVPFVGECAQAHGRFAGRYLRHDPRMRASILDPRYPEVREYLIATYERALVEWDLDGFKLDFVDSFHGDGSEPQGAGDGRDIGDVDEAVDRLLSDAMRRLRALKPELLIEFRQGYVGPLMRTYGNLLRAGDCPADALTNRRRTIDVRLLCGSTAAHADMLMWHPGEAVESAALQLLNVLFAVPQWSMPLDRIPTPQREMATFWTGWWNRHRAVLLDGWLAPHQAAAAYPLVEAGDARERVLAVYDQVVAAPATGIPATLLVVNATLGARVVLDLPEDLGERTLVVHDCRGLEVARTRVRLGAGLHRLDIPAAGVAELTG